MVSYFMVSYLLCALLWLGFDAGLCLQHRRRFQLLQGIVAALIWPLPAAVAAIIAARRTRHAPRWSFKDDADPKERP